MGFFDDWFAWAGERITSRRDSAALQLPAAPVARPSERRIVVSRRRDAGSIVNEMTGLGGANDKGAAGRPNLFFDPLDAWELLSAYSSSGLSRIIIDEVPKRATRKGWDVEGLDTSDDKALQTAARIRHGSQMGRLYGGAAIVMVTEDDVPAGYARQPWKWLEQPMDLERVQKLHALIVFDTFEAHILKMGFRPGPRYRQPELWTIGAEGFEPFTAIHASRTLHARGRRRTPTEQHARGFRRASSRSQFWQQDDSTLQAVWDEISRLTQTMQGGSILAQELSTSVFHIQGMRGAAVGDQADEFVERMALTNQLKGATGAVYLDKEDLFSNVPANVAGYRDLSDGAKSMLSAVTRIPEMVLFGNAPAGLNTDGASGWEGFRQTVSDWQEEELRGLLERTYQVLFASHDSASTGDPFDVKLKFNALDEPSLKEQAEVRESVARADAINIQSGVYTALDVAEHRYGVDGFGIELTVDLGEVAERQKLEEARETLALVAPPQLPGPTAPQGGQGDLAGDDE